MKQLLISILLIWLNNQLACKEIITNDILYGVWEQLPGTGQSFKIYLQSGEYCDIYLYKDGEIAISKSIYGFYENCSPPHIDSLKLKGSGKYFFEIIDMDTEVTESGDILEQRVNCWSISIDNYREKAYFVKDSVYLHFGRSDIIEYKKVNELPSIIISFLKNKNPDIYKDYVDIIEK